MNRRDFLSGAAGMAGLAARRKAHHAAPGARAPQYYDTARLLHAGISSSSFNNFFARTRAAASRLPGPMMPLLDFPGIISDRYQVHHLEFNSLHFATTEPEYLAQLRREIHRARSRLVNIDAHAPEEGGGLSDRDPAARNAAVAIVKQWIDVAHATGAASVSTSPGSVNTADLNPTLDSYRALADYGRRRRVNVLIENGEDTAPGEIIDVLRQAGERTLAALPNFSKFASPSARIAGLELLFSRVITLCHANGVSFDNQGNETTFDFQQCIEIAKRYRFSGIYSVEFDGPGDPYQGVQNVINELMRFL
ncbi:MAG: sugar phosphate isomerase/epimerase family protein [Terriglobia bacterium]